MKATIEFDDALYRRLKVEAAKRGRTVRELVAEGVAYVLSVPPRGADADDSPWQPSWLGSLSRYGRAVHDHSLTAIRTSVSRARANEPRR